VSVVERELGDGLLLCPVEGCGGRVGGWGRARTRTVFTAVAGRVSGRVTVTPRRGRCRRCKATQVLLPAGLVCRRMDGAGVIEAALGLAAGGTGHRRVAARLGRPVSTVRDWLRAARRVAGLGLGAWARLALSVSGDAARVWPTGTGGDPLAGWVGFCRALADAMTRRWGRPSPWFTLITAACRCRVLQTGWWAQHEPALPAVFLPGQGWNRVRHGPDQPLEDEREVPDGCADT